MDTAAAGTIVLSKMQSTEPDISFKRPSTSVGDSAWDVEADGVVIGRVSARERVLANRGRSLLATGWPQRRGRLWEASSDGAELGDDDRALVEAHLAPSNKRGKTTRDGAAGNLLDAYASADVAKPEASAAPPTSS